MFYSIQSLLISKTLLSYRYTSSILKCYYLLYFSVIIFKFSVSENMLWQLVIIAIVPLFVPGFGQIQDPIVSTKIGLIRGSVFKDRNGEDFFAFRGIRYAESPEGDLRWQVRSFYSSYLLN